MTIVRPFAGATPSRRLWPASILENEPPRPREWVVPNRIPAGVVTVLGGEGGIGKSQIALQLAVAAATGTAFLGAPVKRGPAVYIACEDDRDEIEVPEFEPDSFGAVVLFDDGRVHMYDEQFDYLDHPADKPLAVGSGAAAALRRTGGSPPRRV